MPSHRDIWMWLPSGFNTKRTKDTKSEHVPPQPRFEQCNVEIPQKSKTIAGQLQISQELCFMNACQLVIQCDASGTVTNHAS
jgi:hypothetical protein